MAAQVGRRLALHKTQWRNICCQNSDARDDYTSSEFKCGTWIL